MKYTFLSILFFYLGNIQAQEINYEAFAGEPVKMSMEVPMKKIGFTWYNKPDIGEKKQARIRTIFLNKNFKRATSPIALLTKMYHAKTKEELEIFLIDKRFLKRHKVKKVKDYTQNHYLMEYQLAVQHGERRMVVVKYSEIENGKKIGEHALQAISASKRGWLVTEEENLKDVEYVIRTLSAEAFLSFYRTYDSNDKDIDTLRAKVRSPRPKNRINLTTLAEELRKLPQSNPALWKKLQSL